MGKVILERERERDLVVDHVVEKVVLGGRDLVVNHA
jgi:hypothetical protein